MILFRLARLAAFAALAFASIAEAQSTSPSGVSLYGTVDQYLNYARSGPTRLRRLEDGGDTASRLAFTGVEDLGSGLSATFLLEAGFAPDTGVGTLPGPAFGFTRQSFVGLIGRWGRVDLGRMYTPSFYSLFRADPFGVNSVFSPLNLVAATDAQPGLGAFAARASNMVRYRSPASSPILFDVAYAAGESGTGSGNLYGANLGWSRDPWYISYAIQRARSGSAAAPIPSPPMSTYQSISGGFKVTPEFRVVANWMRNTSDLAGVPRANLLHVGFGWNYGLWQLMAGAIRRDVRDSDRSQFSWTLGSDYLLSKRTALYARVLRLANSGGSSTTLAGVPVIANSGNGAESIALGLRHNF